MQGKDKGVGWSQWTMNRTYADEPFPKNYIVLA